MKKCMRWWTRNFRGEIARDEFIRRNSAIYEGIEMQDMQVEITAYDKNARTVTYRTSFDTTAGNISFENEAVFSKGKDGYKLIWTDSLIFPDLDATDKVQVSTTEAERGKILINPLHMACIYSAFCNEGNVIKPYLTYQEGRAPEYWIAGAFSPETAEQVLGGMKKVINDANGTGYAAHREDVVLAGKTGTAEIKASQDDTSGTELGWFAVFTTEKDRENPILIVSMAEDVKERGGCGFVVQKDNAVLEEWLNK